MQMSGLNRFLCYIGSSARKIVKKKMTFMVVVKPEHWGGGSESCKFLLQLYNLGGKRNNFLLPGKFLRSVNRLFNVNTI